MPLDKIADDRREFSNLKIERIGLPDIDAERIFIQPNSHPLIGGIEIAIRAGLDKKVKVRAELGVEKKGKTRIREKVMLSVDQSGRRLLDLECFEVEKSAQARTELAVKCVYRQRVSHPVEKVLSRESGCHNCNQKAEDSEGLHETVALLSTG